MSTIDKLKALNLPADTTVNLTYSEGTDVFHFNETEVETALEGTDVVYTAASLLATPRLVVNTRWVNNVLNEIRDQDLLEDYERGSFSFDEFLASTINENFYDFDFIDVSTEKYDHKRGFTTLTADFNVTLGNLLETTSYLSPNWSVSVQTEAGTLTLD